MSAISRDDDPSCVATRRHALLAVKATATSAAVMVLLALTGVPAAAAETTSNCAPTLLGGVTCVYDKPTVTNYLLRVPVGVTEVHIEARGAGGGNGGMIESRGPVSAGGRGGVVSADFPVAAGGLLRILVGGRGRNAEGMKPGAGGLNGGAPGGAGALGGGGGGGASSVLLHGSDHASRILVAGGGGGAGGAMTSAGVTSAHGGVGGGESGGNGSGDIVGKGGKGATGPSGGAALHRITGLDGHSGYDAWWGGYGGEGGYGASDSIKLKHAGTWATYPVGAGGGGGGYAGGGGGAAGPTVGGGGGGGSGFVATSALAPSVARLGTAELVSGGTGRLEDGVVVITYRLPADQPDRAKASVSGGSDAATSNGRRRRI